MIIHGRTIELTSTGSKLPMGKAEVKVIGIWRKLSEVITSCDPPNKNLPVFIYTPLYADRSTKTRCKGGVLSRVEDKVLLNPAREGADKIRLSNSTNLKLKHLLKIDVGDPYREEVLTITKIDPGSGPDQPAWVTLSWTLMFSHREGSVVSRLRQTWKASSNQLAEDSQRGHTTLLLNKRQGFISDTYVRISSTSGNVPDEFHKLRIYETESKNDGFYELPPLQRVGQVKVQATGNGKKADVCFQPDYSLNRNQLDLVLTL